MKSPGVRLKNPPFGYYAALILGAILFLFPVGGYAQEADSTKQDRRFLKGSWMSGIRGSIRSQGLIDPFGEGGENQVIIFSLGTENGYFLANRVSLGVFIDLSSNLNEGASESLNIESLSIGPQVGYFLPFQNEGAFSLRGGVGYSGINRTFTQEDSTGIRRDEQRSVGWYFQGGPYFHYFFTRNVAFEVGALIKLGFLRTRSTNELGEVTNQNLRASEIEVKFGLSIFLEEFFF